MALKPGAGRRLLAGAVLAVAAYYALWGGEYSVFDLLTLERDTRDAEAALARTRREADSLRAEAKRLEDDPATIERVARERFGMIREGEVLYRFVPVDSGAPQGASRP
ncbi:MAG TPA: septum formation initiator family protein [Longimicrobium sp.]|nr:septum formation initiator family protein [Longimicrobium sp.]